MGRIGRVAAAGATVVALALTGCVDADQFSYESALSSVDRAAAATPTVMPAALTKVAAKKAAPIPKPVYSEKRSSGESAEEAERRRMAALAREQKDAMVRETLANIEPIVQLP